MTPLPHQSNPTQLEKRAAAAAARAARSAARRAARRARQAAKRARRAARRAAASAREEEENALLTHYTIEAWFERMDAAIDEERRAKQARAEAAQAAAAARAAAIKRSPDLALQVCVNAAMVATSIASGTKEQVR